MCCWKMLSTWIHKERHIAYPNFLIPLTSFNKERNQSGIVSPVQKSNCKSTNKDQSISSSEDMLPVDCIVCPVQKSNSKKTNKDQSMPSEDMLPVDSIYSMSSAKKQFQEDQWRTKHVFSLWHGPCWHALTQCSMSPGPHVATDTDMPRSMFLPISKANSLTPNGDLRPW